MYGGGKMPNDPRILMVKLSAMGDIIHALPAAASLKSGFPSCHLAWLVKSKWAPLLEGNPYVDEVIPFDRASLSSLLETRRRLRALRFDMAIDFQGLIQSALIARSAGASRTWGFGESAVREQLAVWFYSDRAAKNHPHVVDQYLDLAVAAGAKRCVEFPLPGGRPEGRLPGGPFVLASPYAGWGAKQWPLAHYAKIAAMLKVPLVLNGPPGMPKVKGTREHISGLPGLIDATRRATAVIGVDSGPLHLAAALKKPGVAIFGPTDPVRNGPYGGSFVVLRAPDAQTSYKRATEAASMHAISPESVFESLCVISSQNLTPIS